MRSGESLSAESHDSDIRGVAGRVRRIHGNGRYRISLWIYILRDIGHKSCAGLRRNPNLPAGRSAQRAVTVRDRVYHRRIAVGILRTTGGDGIYQVDFVACAQACPKSFEVVAQLQRRGAAGADSPHAASSYQHLAAILRIQNVRSKESSIVTA